LIAKKTIFVFYICFRRESSRLSIKSKKTNMYQNKTDFQQQNYSFLYFIAEIYEKQNLNLN